MIGRSISAAFFVLARRGYRFVKQTAGRKNALKVEIRALSLSSSLKP